MLTSVVHCIKIINRSSSWIRTIHCSLVSNAKLFTDTENSFAYQFLPKLNATRPLIMPKNELTTEAFESILNRNYRTTNADEIVAAFERISPYCVRNNISLEDRRFDKIVDGLMDHCEKLTDDQLLGLLKTIAVLPATSSISARNFHDVWSCLDDICCWKMGTWSVEKLFTYADIWYHLNLGRLCDYIFELLDRMEKKPSHYTRNNLLRIYFYINICRKKSVYYNFEFALAKHIGNFTVDELGLIAMAYFKSRSKIKTETILLTMINSVIQHAHSIHEITLTAILKALRFTQNIGTVDDISRMLDRLVPEIDRLSHVCCLHIALAGTGLQLHHATSLSKATAKVLDNIDAIRLKDIERILLVNTMFNVTNPALYQAAYDELHKTNRRKEFVQYNRCLPCSLHYLSLQKIYSYQLMDEVLNADFIEEVYGKGARNLPRELFSLDYCIELECPDYGGNRLHPVRKYKAAKWLSDYAPAHDQYQKLSLSDKIYLDVVDHVKMLVGNSGFIRNDHILPHFSRPDVIVCKNRITGEFVEPFGFENYVLGDIKRPFYLDRYKWYAIVIMVQNITIRGTNLPLGSVLMKERQLKSIGYSPLLVAWSDFMPLNTEEKLLFLRDKLV